MRPIDRSSASLSSGPHDTACPAPFSRDRVAGGRRWRKRKGSLFSQLGGRRGSRPFVASLGGGRRQARSARPWGRSVGARCARLSHALHRRRNLRGRNGGRRKGLGRGRKTESGSRGEKEHHLTRVTNRQKHSQSVST